MFYLLISLLIPVLMGFTFVSILWPGSIRANLFVKSCLAIGTGFGIFSLLFFLFLSIFGASRKGLLLAEAVLIISLVAGLVYKIKRQKSDEGGLNSAAG